MALTPQQREDVFTLIQSEGASHPARAGALFRQLYDLIFASNAQRTAALQGFLDELIASASTAIANHDAAVAAAKTAMEAKRDALTTLRNAV